MVVQSLALFSICRCLTGVLFATCRISHFLMSSASKFQQLQKLALNKSQVEQKSEVFFIKALKPSLRSSRHIVQALNATCVTDFSNAAAFREKYNQCRSCFSHVFHMRGGGARRQVSQTQSDASFSTPPQLVYLVHAYYFSPFGQFHK